MTLSHCKLLLIVFNHNSPLLLHSSVSLVRNCVDMSDLSLIKLVSMSVHQTFLEFNEIGM